MWSQVTWFHRTSFLSSHGTSMTAILQLSPSALTTGQLASWERKKIIICPIWIRLYWLFCNRSRIPFSCWGRLVLAKTYIVFVVSKNKVKLVQSSGNDLLTEVLYPNNLLRAGRVSTWQLTEGKVHYFLLTLLQIFLLWKNIQIITKFLSTWKYKLDKFMWMLYLNRSTGSPYQPRFTIPLLRVMF